MIGRQQDGKERREDRVLEKGRTEGGEMMRLAGNTCKTGNKEMRGGGGEAMDEDLLTSLSRRINQRRLRAVECLRGAESWRAARGTMTLSNLQQTAGVRFPCRGDGALE